MRWLHCSDFHTGKDRTAQERLFDKIVEHVAQQVASGFVPDLVFLTGDIANKGLTREYKEFRENFIQPLRQALGGDDWSGRILAVPGNHDVDRAKNDSFNQKEFIAAGSHHFDPNPDGKQKRDILSPRFKAYRQGTGVDLSGDWLNKPAGAFAEAIEINNTPIGVVGINTAWLSKGDDDRQRLTPGIELVEGALEQVKACPVRIVLGHHPLSWLHDDQARRLRALFGEYRVIYLHGHLHRAEGSREDGAGHDFLAIQSGAAFQARDGERWDNGLLWGEIDTAGEQVRLSPRFWNPDNRDWPVWSGRFPENRRLPNSDWWAFPLPKDDSARFSGWSAPRGWEMITAQGLDGLRREVTADEAERFFDGAEPDWGVALCPEIPRREVVDELAQQLATYAGTERPLVIPLIGPGGEGKSMALRQSLVAALERNESIALLWRTEEDAPLPAAALAQLPPGPWIVATDAADLVAKPLFEAVAELRHARRSDVRLLLCARDTDWRASGAEKLDWRKHAEYRPAPLMSGLSEGEAERIATAWATFEGSDSTGQSARRARALYEAARHEAAVDEGSLLGGALAVRHGDGLRAHVARLLDRLVEHRLESGGTLYHAFGYIAVMHAEGLDFLSRPVLAAVLDCDPRQLGPQVLLPLAREAAANGGSVLLTRHRRIAEAAVAIMVEEYGEEIGGRFEELARTALASRKDVFIPEFARWEYDLPKHFLKKSPERAVGIARALAEADPHNSKLAVNLARTYRECGDPARGAEVLERFAGDVGNDRGLWYEWGTCAGQAGEEASSALLGGWSLADQAAWTPPDTQQAKLSLAGLGVAFGELHERYRDPRFVAGRGAVAHLGLQLPLDATARGYFERHQRDAKAAGAVTTDNPEALRQLATALAAACEVSGQPPNITSRIEPPERMTFSGLARLFAE